MPRSLLHDKRISATDKLVYMALASRANARLECWPSHKKIAEDAGVSDATVKRSLKHLREFGLVEWQQRFEGRVATSNLYRLGGSGQIIIDEDVEGGGVRMSEGVGSERPQGGVTMSDKRDSLNETHMNDRKTRAQAKEIPLPDDWKPTEKHVIMAAEKGLDLKHEAEVFRLHAETHDRRAVVWNAAFSTWLTKAKPLPQNVQRLNAPQQPRKQYGIDRTLANLQDWAAGGQAAVTS